MILGIYATLGVFLMIASRDPMAHRSLIWFTVWSSIVHGVIMAAQSVANPQHIGHLWGDVLASSIMWLVRIPSTWCGSEKTGAAESSLRPRFLRLSLADHARRIESTGDDRIPGVASCVFTN